MLVVKMYPAINLTKDRNHVVLIFVDLFECLSKFLFVPDIVRTDSTNTNRNQRGLTAVDDIYMAITHTKDLHLDEFSYPPPICGVLITSKVSVAGVFLTSSKTSSQSVQERPLTMTILP